jgi:cell shape-determining protein MreC
MTPTEVQYCQRALKELEKSLTVSQRIKIQKTMAQILSRSADRLEQHCVSSVEQKLYGKQPNG